MKAKMWIVRHPSGNLWFTCKRWVPFRAFAVRYTDAVEAILRAVGVDSGEAHAIVERVFAMTDATNAAPAPR